MLRRDLLRAGAAGLGLLALDGLALPGRAEAATLWNPGPRSGLPYWLGGYNGIDELNALMPAGRGLDLVHLFEPAGSYQATFTALAGWFPRIREVAMLVAGTAAGLQWTSSPFCYGAGNPSPAAWPSGPEAVTADLWLSTARPPTFTGSESASERTAKQRRLWQMAASGWLDPVWRAKFKAIKRDCFVKMNLRDIRIVLRVAHELNLKGTGGGWGETSMQRSHGIGVLDDPAQDPYIVREALRRYIRRFLDVFGAVQPDIPGDFAYGANQLWPYWCPVPEQFHPFDVSLACPPNARLVGPDVYDFWPPTFTQAEFDAKAAATSKQGWPKGMAAWADWAVAHGRLLAIGEFGLVSWTKNPDGSRPYFEGWDNPAFINLMLDFFQANAARLAFACYFNRDYAAAADMPASYIAPWAGLEDAATACERQPVGDNNRCGARAWRNRLAR
ncbi:MAG: hypothetical protein U1E17_01835 [Geminicoccaceae bacterium]